MSKRTERQHIQEIWARDIHDGDKFAPSYIPAFTTPEEFIDAKIEMLRKHFKIEPTIDDIIFLKKFKTEIGINNAVKSILNKYWE